MIIALLLSLIFAFVSLGLGVLLLAICAVAALCRSKSARPENPFILSGSTEGRVGNVTSQPPRGSLVAKASQKQPEAETASEYQASPAQNLRFRSTVFPSRPVATCNIRQPREPK